MGSDHVSSLAVVDGDEAELAALVALAGLPNLSPGRFRSMLAVRHPSALWNEIVSGRPPLSGRSRDAAHRWAAWAAQVDPPAVLHAHRVADVRISWPGVRAYPRSLLDDPDPPVVVFEAGVVPIGHRQGVSVVGTRRCTRYGRDVANELGARLARAGVPVVSGLAHGIDAAAHAGAVRQGGPVAAVVANGVDVVYPRSNSGLWNDVKSCGSILSEYPLGATPLTWRFPARNRLIAALSVMVIVVESPEKGGSMYTVDEAMRRDRLVAAVPGSIRSVVSAGTNRLIADGAIPICSIDELIDLVPGDFGQGDAGKSEAGDDHLGTGDPTGSSAEPAAVTAGVDSWLLELVSFDPVSLDLLVDESKRSAAEVALEVERLVAAGTVHRSGATVERVR